jgi:hypothetical protein
MSALVREPHEPRAIEIAAVLGGSVVGMKHCIDPNSGKVTPTTWALIAGGTLALLASAIAFVVSVTTAGANQRAFATWTQVLHRPPAAFRAELLSPAWDALAFGGLAAGIAALALALVRARDERRSPDYRIGTAPGVDQPLEQAPSASFPLVAPAGDEFVFQFATGIDGELVTAGRRASLDELVAAGRAQPSRAVVGAFALPIPADATIHARTGRAAFVISSVPRPRRQATALFALDGRAVKYFAGSLVAHLGLWALFQVIPADGGAANIDLASYETTSTSSSSATAEEATRPREDRGDDAGGDGAAAAARMALPEGMRGNRTGTSDPRRQQVAHRDHIDPQLARQEAIELARTAGFMGDSSLVGTVSDLASSSEVSSGFDTRNLAGPIFGPDGGSGGPGFGTGRNGFMPGGGGTQLVEGGYGGSCDEHCTGSYGRWGLRVGSTGTRGHLAAVPVVVPAPPVAVGGLDKSIIRRYIKRNLAKIAYCYEHELLAHPELAGTIAVRFFIQPDGGVKDSTASGLDATVARCVADVVSAIQFPRPDGGGVEVSYPFTFHPAGR